MGAAGLALKWMLECAIVVPGGLKHDPSVLRLYPYPEGMQHDEVKAGLGLVTKLFGVSWSEAHRPLRDKQATMHRSVYERFDLPEVQLYDHLGPYRPETLREHVDFAPFYGEGAPFPATSGRDPKAMAGKPSQDGPVVASIERAGTGT